MHGEPLRLLLPPARQIPPCYLALLLSSPERVLASRYWRDNPSPPPGRIKKLGKVQDHVILLGREGLRVLQGKTARRHLANTTRPQINEYLYTSAKNTIGKRGLGPLGCACLLPVDRNLGHFLSIRGGSSRFPPSVPKVSFFEPLSSASFSH